MRRPLAVSALAAAAIALAGGQSAPPRPFGFSRAGADAQQRVEGRFLSLPDTTRIRDAHAFLADKPHVAGSARDKELADWTARAFTDAGLQDVLITTHEVLLPWPVEVSVEMTAPR